MTLNPILCTGNPYQFDSEPQRIHFSFPTKEQIAHYLENEGLNDKTFFDALKKNKYNEDIAIGLIDRCLEELDDPSPHLNVEAIRWLHNYLEVARSNKDCPNSKLELLLSRCEKRLARIMKCSNYNISLPILFLVKTYRNQCYFSCIKNNSMRKYIDDTLNKAIGRNLSDLISYCKKEHIKIYKEISGSFPTDNYLRYIGNPNFRHMGLRISNPDEGKYSLQFRQSQRINRERLIQKEVRNNDYYATQIMNVKNLKNKYDYYGGLCSLKIPSNLKYLVHDRNLVSYYISKARDCLNGNIPEDAPKNGYGMQIDAIKGIKTFLREICRHPENYANLYDDFLYDCEIDYKENFERLNRDIEILLQDLGDTDQERHRILMSYSATLEPEPLGLWYCLRTEFGCYNGANKYYHTALKHSIMEAGLGTVFLTKDGNFLENYDAKVLIKALEIQIERIERQEKLDNEPVIHSIDSDHMVSVQISNEGLLSVQPTEELEEKKEED